MTDPVLDELRDIRRRLTEACGGDIERYAQMLQETVIPPGMKCRYEPLPRRTTNLSGESAAERQAAMEIRESQQLEVTVGFVCDICHQNCAPNPDPGFADAHEHATLFAEWGYWSRDKDMTWHECHMCESCFEKVKKYIEVELKGTVRTGDHGDRQETR